MKKSNQFFFTITHKKKYKQNWLYFPLQNNYCQNYKGVHVLYHKLHNFHGA